MNQLSEQPRVDRATGGKGGGGAVLTRYGQRLIQLYDLLAQIQQKAFDVLSDDDALPDVYKRQSQNRARQKKLNN